MNNNIFFLKVTWNRIMVFLTFSLRKCNMSVVIAIWCRILIHCFIPFKNHCFNPENFNHRHNFCRLFHILAQFLFTTSESKLYYYNQKINVRVSSWVTERLKENRKLENFKKILEKLGFDAKSPVGHPKAKFQLLY